MSKKSVGGGPSSGPSGTKPQIVQPIRSVKDALEAAKPRPKETSPREDKKNYAERFSRALAIMFANHLREHFRGITPDELGRRQEARARTAKGYKRLDVNYSTPELGLGLGVSVKTLNFRDQATKRYTKNFTRIDNELRAEANDYHERQPYSVLVAVIFLPGDSCEDATSRAHSSFAQAISVFRRRDERREPTDRAERFERLFVALYDSASGSTCYFDVLDDPPESGAPPKSLCRDLNGLKGEIVATFDARNR